MDLIGISNQIIIGKRNVENNNLEIKNRKKNKLTKVNLKNINQIFKQLN